MQTKSELLAGLKAEARLQGLTLQSETADGFKAEIESILVKWMLGKKTAVFRLSAVLDEAAGTVKFRDMVKETSSGILPPTLTVETTSYSGTKLSGRKTETAPGAGGGSVDYGKLREAFAAAAASAGWRFDYEAGRAP